MLAEVAREISENRIVDFSSVFIRAHLRIPHSATPFEIYILLCMRGRYIVMKICHRMVTYLVFKA